MSAEQSAPYSSTDEHYGPAEFEENTIDETTNTSTEVRPMPAGRRLFSLAMISFAIDIHLLSKRDPCAVSQHL